MVRNEGMRRAEVADARARVPKRLLVDEEGEEEVAGGKVGQQNFIKCHLVLRDLENYKLNNHSLGGGSREWSDQPRTEAATDGEHAAG